jgi:hypothetical protein
LAEHRSCRIWLLSLEVTDLPNPERKLPQIARPLGISVQNGRDLCSGQGRRRGDRSDQARKRHENASNHAVILNGYIVDTSKEKKLVAEL